jgi:glutamate racemase
MNNLNQPIGIFDSGVGGLGIFKEVAKRLPNENLIYFADSKNIPYGAKSSEEIQQLTARIIDFLISEHNIKMAVVACNTATTSSLDYLRGRFSVPIVGAVPVVKPACEQSKTKKIAILATVATIKSKYHENLIQKFGHGVEVLSIACPGLVELVEQGTLDSPELMAKLNEYLKPVLQASVDVIGLGCTHYPFLIESIRKIVGQNVAILDSNIPVASQVVRVLGDLPSEQHASQNQKNQHIFYTTKDDKKFKILAEQLLNTTVETVKLVNL